MTIQLATGAVDFSVDVQIVDDTGLPVTGLVANTFPTVTRSTGSGADVTVTLSDLETISSAHANGGLKERGGGYYRLDLPDLADGVHTFRGETTGKRLLCPRVQVGAEAAIADAVVAAVEETGIAIEVSGPVLQDGAPLLLTQGDDYTAEASPSTAITMTLTGTGLHLTSADDWELVLNTPGAAAVVVEADTDGGTTDQIGLSFDVTAAESASLTMLKEGTWTVQQVTANTPYTSSKKTGPLVVSRNPRTQRS